MSILLAIAASGFFVQPGAGDGCDGVFNQTPDHSQNAGGGGNTEEHGEKDAHVEVESKPRKKAGDDCCLHTGSKARADGGIPQDHYDAQKKRQHSGDDDEIHAGLGGEIVRSIEGFHLLP